MQPTRVRVIESPTVARLEEALNATLAALEADPAVAAIETITYRPGVLADGAVLTAMIVYCLAPPAPEAAAVVAEAETILEDEQLPEADSGTVS